MKRLPLLPLAFLLLLHHSLAQPSPDQDKAVNRSGTGRRRPHVSLRTAAVSAYTWRGRVLNDELSLQPGVSAEWSDARLNLWGTWDLTGAPGSASRERLDATLSYVFRCDAAYAELGVTGYLYLPDDPTAPADTAEAFVVYALDTVLLPSIMISYDFLGIDGVYIEASLGQSFEFSDRVALDCRLQLGWAEENYAVSQFSLPADVSREFAGYVPDDGLLVELKIEALLPIRVSDRIELQPGIAWMTSLDPDLRDALDAAKEETEAVVLSFAVSSVF